MTKSLGRRLTVLQIVPWLHGGGVERGTLEVAKALVDTGHRSLVASGGGALVEQLEDEGSEHFDLEVGRKSLRSLSHIGTLKRLWQTHSVDIVHARSRLPAWLSFLAWRSLPAKARPRFVTTVHGAYSVNPYSAVMLRGERVIAVSDTIAQYVTNNYPRFDARRLVTIHRGVDAAVFPHGYRPSAEWLARWQQEFPQLEGKFVLALVGRLTRLKGHADFFALLEALAARGRAVHGLVVGGAEPGPRARYASEIQAQAVARSIPVTFVGRRADVRDIYAVSDLVVSLSSQPESFGRSVLEALCLGRPVLGYDHGGVGEVLQRVFPQGAVRLGDIDAMVDKAMVMETAHDELHAGETFSLQRMLELTLDLYEEIAGESAAHGDKL